MKIWQHSNVDVSFFLSAGEREESARTHVDIGGRRGGAAAADHTFEVSRNQFPRALPVINAREIMHNAGKEMKHK